jgi:5-formyltetrahydrofolate cyclo-ligase
MTKKDMRIKYLALRRSLEAEARELADASICTRLRELPELFSAQYVGAYVSDGTEPGLDAFLRWAGEQGKKIFLPRFSAAAEGYEMVETPDLEKDLVAGAYGIREPRPELPAVAGEFLKNLVWLVPGVAFDVTGARLGRGKGIYDRLLACGDGLKIGIFYQCQQDPEIPCDPHDHRLDMVVTETEVFRFSNTERKK